MTSVVAELAQALGTRPDALRARLGYYKIKVRGKTRKQLAKEMKAAGLLIPEDIPEGVIELDGQGPRTNGNGNGAAHASEVNLANRLHGIRERLERIEPLARVNVRSGTNGPWEAYFLNLLHYARTGEELDIQNLVRELKKD